MKINILSLISFAGLSMMTSCVNEFMNEETASVSENALRITTSCTGISRASSSYEGEDLNLSLFYSDNDATATSFDFFNTKWTKAGNGTWSSSEPVFWKDRSTKAKIYAFVPYSDLGGTVNAASLKSVSFSVQMNQKSEDAFLKSDFASYGGMDLDPNDYINKTFPIVLTHRLAQMKVKVSFNDSYTGNKNVTGVKINAETSCAINVIEGKVVDSAEGTAKDATEDVTAMNNGENEYAAILPPQNIRKVIVSVDEKNYTYNAPDDVAHQLEANKIYTLNLSLGKKGLSMGEVTLEDWTAGDLVLDRTKGIWTAVQPPLNSDVYEISIPEHLAWVVKATDNQGSFPAAGIKLMNDIDMSAHYLVPGSLKRGNSRTTFDGNGKTIKGLTIDAANVADGQPVSLGMFTDVERLTITDLTLDNPVIKHTDEDAKYCKIGVLCGTSKFTYIANVNINNASISLATSYVAGATTGRKDCGGIAGTINSKGYIFASSFDGLIKYDGENGSTRAATLTSNMDQSLVLACHSSGDIIYSKQTDYVNMFVADVTNFPRFAVYVDACYTTLNNSNITKVISKENQDHCNINHTFKSAPSSADIAAMNEYIKGMYNENFSMNGEPSGTSVLKISDQINTCYEYVKNTDPTTKNKKPYVLKPVN